MDAISTNDLPFENLSFEELADAVLRREQFPLRSAAMRRLAELARQSPERLSLLKAALLDEESSTRRRAAQTLGCCGALARSLLENLCATMRTDPMWTVREAAAHAVRSVCLPAGDNFDWDAIPQQILECALSDREPLVREAAIGACAGILADANVRDTAKAAIWESLQAAMGHSQESRRCRAATALCELGAMNPAVFPVIALGLRDSHWKVRRTTARLLGEHPDLVGSEAGLLSLLPELVKRRFDLHGIVQNTVRETLYLVHSARADAETRELLAKLMLHPSPVAILADVSSSGKLSEPQETEFRQLCERRRKWLSKTIPSAKKQRSEMDSSLEEPTRAMIGRAADAEKEAAWLLARWLEIYFTAERDLRANG